MKFSINVDFTVFSDIRDDQKEAFADMIREELQRFWGTQAVITVIMPKEVK